MRFSRQECWGGLPFPTPGDLPNPGLEPASPESPALAGGFFTMAPLGKPTTFNKVHIFVPLWLVTSLLQEKLTLGYFFNVVVLFFFFPRMEIEVFVLECNPSTFEGFQKSLWPLLFLKDHFSLKKIVTCLCIAAL